MIFQSGHSKCLPSAGTCLSLGGMYVLGSYRAFMNRRRKIQITSWIPAAAKLTESEVMKVVVVAAWAVSLFALSEV